MMFRENQQVGYYTLIRFLGRGGFGEVWLAEKQHTSPPERVAIKLPHGDQLDLQAVKDEIFNWILSGKHKNILPIIECESFGNQIAIVSEYAAGGSLKDLLEREGRLPAAEAARMTAGILEGLAHLHQRKIIHRDLKPENILLQEGIPRLADFGISRMATGSHSSTGIVGTQSYMAPESFDGKRTPQTDIWAVGVILYLLLSGRLPFPQQDITQLLGAIVMQAPPPLPDGIPAALASAAQRALAKDPAERFGSAAEMLAALGGAAGAGGAAVITNENVPPRISAPLHPTVPMPARNQAITAVLTAAPKQKSKTGWIALSAFLILAAFGVVAAVLGIFKTVPPGMKDSQVNQESGNNSKIYGLPGKTTANFSVDLIDETLAATEKASGGKLKMTQFRLIKNDGQFVGGLITAKDAGGNDYYDTYFYNFLTRTTSKTPVKDPSSFETAGGKWFSREDVNWNALPGLMEKILAKAKEVNESGANLTIAVSRKAIGFSPDRFGDIIIEMKISGARKDVALTADADGGNVKLTLPA